MFSRSCFHPEAPLKVRNSAFCLVAPVAVGCQQENKLVALKRPIPTSQPPTNGSSQSYSVQSGTKSKQQKLMCNIAIDKSNRERILMQEKSDFELAKMLQEFDQDVRSPTSNNGTNRKTTGRKSTRSATTRSKRGATTSLSSNSTATTTSDVAENNESNGQNGDSLRTRRYFLRNRNKANPTNSSSTKRAKVVRVPNKATASSRLKKGPNH